MNSGDISGFCFLYFFLGLLMLVPVAADFESQDPVTVEPTVFLVSGIVLLWPLFLIRLVIKMLVCTTKALFK